MHLADLTNTQFFFLTLVSLCVCYAVATAIALVNDSRSADSGHQWSLFGTRRARLCSATSRRRRGRWLRLLTSPNVRGNVLSRPTSTVRAVPSERLKATSHRLMNCCERCARAALDAARQALLDPVSSDR